MLEAIKQQQKLMYAPKEYIAFPNALTKEQCQEILDYTEGKWEIAETVANTKEISGRIRQSDVVWCTKQKFFQMVDGLVNDANSVADWNFQTDAIEDLQITRYKKGGFFNYHADTNGFTRLSSTNKVRKLSVSIILNDEFEGGEFEFLGHQKPVETNGVGTVIIFPSYMVHRVRPIKNGTRYSLVAWICGEPFV